MIRGHEEFIKWGDLDCEAARVLFEYSISSDDKRYWNIDYVASFLCAQAVEKYLKGYLFWRMKLNNPKISNKDISEKLRKLKHNLSKILNKCLEEEEKFESCRPIIKTLDSFSLLKYPDIEEELLSTTGIATSSDNVGKALNIGCLVKEIVGSK